MSSAGRLPPRVGIAVALAVLGASSPAESTAVDRTVIRFVAPETGGVQSPRFISERILAFEARLEALADAARPRDDPLPYRERHVRAAVERHIAETLLESLEIHPPPSEADVMRRTEAARVALVERAGGQAPVDEAARAEGIDPSEIARLVRRQAMASLYLDRMVAPMLSPSEAELRNIHRTARTPYSALPYDQVSGILRRWYVSRQLGAALEAFYEGARSRLEVIVLEP